MTRFFLIMNIFVQCHLYDDSFRPHEFSSFSCEVHFQLQRDRNPEDRQKCREMNSASLDTHTKNKATSHVKCTPILHVVSLRSCALEHQFPPPLSEDLCRISSSLADCGQPRDPPLPPSLQGEIQDVKWYLNRVGTFIINHEKKCAIISHEVTIKPFDSLTE